MFQLILTGDTIDQGRIKINSFLFTGITANGGWSSINSGANGFSIEMSGETSFTTGNQDTSTNSGNIIVGTGNTIFGSGGYNFVQGINNYIASSQNSFVNGIGNNLTAITDSFVFGKYNSIYGGNYIFINGLNIVFSSNTLNNNYISILNSYENTFENQALSTNPINNYLTILNNSLVYFTADTQFVTILSSSATTISGTVTNSFVNGWNNNIGSGFTGINDNIYIFGSNITPSYSANTLVALSGTYVNSLCIEDSLLLNYNNQFVYTGLTANPNQPGLEVDLNINNLVFLSSSAGTATGNYFSSISANTINCLLGSGLFFVNWENASAQNIGVSGDTNYFIDEYGYNSRWDLPSNTLSANTIFCNYSPVLGKYFRYRG